MDTSSDNPYVQERERRIAENKRKLQEMGILVAKAEFEAAVNELPRVSKRVRCNPQPKVKLATSDVRRSSRARPEVNYCEDKFDLNDRLPANKGERKVKCLERSEVDLSLFPVKHTSNIDSGKGVRLQGGRVYDSKFGVTCHWCRQKTVEEKVQCTSVMCGGGKRLPTSFCKNCLWNRNGEDVVAAKASGKWICPCCRVSCGEGCDRCCNCGPCRKKAGLGSTYQLVRQAEASGFSNAHDYLVHLNAGHLSAAAIAARKLAAPWSQWMTSSATKPAALVKEEDVVEEGRVGNTDNRPQKGEIADAAVLEQQVLTDSLRVVKGAMATQLDNKLKPILVTRRGVRKQRIMQAMGLMPHEPLSTCA